jgi:class 3 adenylate cyclase/tetratricopeptide (TPR) repeat protein
VRDVAVWLAELGLGKYAQTFEDHEIDFEALPHLTESMLESLGLPIGARAKLLAAIKQLADEKQGRRKSDRGTLMQGPERRQITVMFCDIVDSTRLARRLDPEDLRALMQAYQAAARTCVERYGGHVAQYLGDGVLAYFGWPAGHEDAAEMGVRAGLEIVEAVKALEAAERVEVRVGISTGVVVVADMAREDPSAPRGAVGEAPYVAHHLQQFAKPNSVVIADSTHQLVSARFVREPLGPKYLKGMAEPVEAFTITGVRDDSGRFQAGQAKALTPLVDRQSELALLRQRWQEARDGEGHVIFVSGVAGVGKSRIVHELQVSIAEPHIALSFQCLPHCTQSSLFPVIQQISRLARLNPKDTDEAKLEKLEKLFASASTHMRSAMPFIAQMMSIPTGKRYPALTQTPLEVKVQTFAALTDLLVAFSTQRPLCCVVEDAQWIDPSTQELLDVLMRQIRRARILLIVTHRPEYHRRPDSDSQVSTITITRLRRRDVEDMAQLVLRQHSVSPTVMKRIIDDSDAIPLFVEELARSAVEAGDVKQQAGSSTFPGTWSVPNSLRDALVARLDRAPQARRVAQLAAVVGREFSYDVLQRIASLPPDELDSGLAHLEHSEIVQQSDSEAPRRYMFKHALLRDAAYDSLLKASRRELHGKVAETIESASPDTVNAQPELLAYHYGLAGKAELAVRYWLLGAQRARSRSALLEALAQFQTALEFLQFLPESQERTQTELEVQLSLGLCCIAVRGYSDDDTRKAFEQARALSAQLGEPQKEMQAMFGLWGHYWMRARHDRALELSHQLVNNAEILEDAVAIAVGHRSIGSTLFTFGDLVGARDYLERAISLTRGVDIRKSFLSYAVDPRIAAHLLLGWDLWILGYPDRALEHVLMALEQAKESADPYTIAFSYYVNSAVHLLRGEAELSLQQAERSFAISKKHGINLYALYSQFGRGCALSAMGAGQQALPDIVAGIEAARRSHLGYMRGFMLGWLATAQAQTGDLLAAQSTLEESFSYIDDVWGRTWEAELRRLRADTLLLSRPDAAEEAERGYRAAIEVAVRQQAKSLELRAVCSLAALMARHGRQAEARKLLQPLYESFTEGLQTADLGAARQLLVQLG